MPRQKLSNEVDAAKLLAKSTLLVAQGKMSGNNLHAITGAMALYLKMLIAARMFEATEKIKKEDAEKKMKRDAEYNKILKELDMDDDDEDLTTISSTEKMPIYDSREWHEQGRLIKKKIKKLGEHLKKKGVQ